MSDHPEPEPSKKASQTTSNDHREEAPFNRWNTLAVTIFTGVLAVLALLQYRSMQKQAGYMRDGLQITRESNEFAAKAANAAEDSVKLAKETNALDQRAWVAPVGFQGAPVEGQKFTVAIRISNSGKTFARDVLNHTFWCTRPKEAPDPDFKQVVESKDKPGHGTILPPGAPDVGNDADILDGAILTSNEVKRFESGDDVAIVFGKITYEDIFGCKHWTTYCYRYVHPNKWDTHTDYYNDADNNKCP